MPCIAPPNQDRQVDKHMEIKPWSSNIGGNTTCMLKNILAFDFIYKIFCYDDNDVPIFLLSTITLTEIEFVPIGSKRKLRRNGLLIEDVT